VRAHSLYRDLVLAVFRSVLLSSSGPHPSSGKDVPSSCEHIQMWPRRGKVQGCCLSEGGLANPVNVAIHIICVPLIVWSFQVLIADLGLPSYFPSYYHKFNDYLVFNTNPPLIFATVYLVYYFLLEPVATVPILQSALLTLTSA
jgi:hypothetical protein